MHEAKRLFPLPIAVLVSNMILGLGVVPVEARQESAKQGQTVTTEAAPPAILVPSAQPTENPDSIPELIIAGHAVIRLRATAGGLTPRERAYSLRQRLGPILTLPDLTADDVQVRQERPGQTASIYVRQRLLITVDRNLAQANNTSVGGLAQQWARNLRDTLPRVNVSVRMSGQTSWGSSQKASKVPPIASSAVDSSVP